MSQPPAPENGPPNVVDPDVLAARRRARHAEIGEDAALELRLFDAERRLGELAAERDALRTRLEEHERTLRDVRQREWAEQQERLEAQGEAAAARGVAAGEVAELRSQLAEAEVRLVAMAAERDRLRIALGSVEAAAEQRIVAERRAFSAQVGAIERAVATVRERLGSAVRTLQERLAAEHAAREVAESALVAEREAGRRARVHAAWLDEQLARRTDEEAGLREALALRDAELAARVETVLGMAAALRDRVDGEGAEALSAALATLQERAAEAASLRSQLDAERAARWVAEAELEAERRRAAEDRTALAAAQAELAELRETARPAGPDAASLASLRETLARLRTPAGDDPGAEPTVTFDLAAAAQRLRAAMPEQAAADPSPAPATERPLRLVPLPARDPVTVAGPWLRDSLLALAADEPDLAEQLLVSLLPAQRVHVRKSLAYELAVADGGSHRVVLVPDSGRVEAAAWPSPPTRIAGPLAALVPLAAGGAARRLPGADVDGRRHVRRLLKARRETIGLAELVAAGVTPVPGPLLAALARAVEPRWTAGRPLSVDVVAAGTDTWRVVASGEGPLKVLPAVATVAPARATLHAATGQLTAVLAGLHEPGDASVEGDLKAVRTLLSWFDRAQRASR